MPLETTHPLPLQIRRHGIPVAVSNNLPINIECRRFGLAGLGHELRHVGRIAAHFALNVFHALFGKEVKDAFAPWTAGFGIEDGKIIF